MREALRIEEDALYSAKCQFESARLWRAVHYWIGIPSAVLAGVASALAFQGAGMIAGILGIAVAAFVSLSTFLNPNERAASHHSAGARFNALRNRARIFYEVEYASPAENVDHVTRLKELAEQRDELNLASPQVSRWAFVRARRGIEQGEAAYAIDRRRRR